MIQELERRLRMLQTALAEAGQLGDMYSRVISLCDENPPRPDHHMAVLEKRVQVARLECEDAVHRQRAAAYQREHLRLHERPRMEAELQRSERMHAQVLAKLAALHERQQQEAAHRARRDARREELVGQAQAELELQERARLRQQSAQQVLYEQQLKTSVAAHKQRVAMYEVRSATQGGAGRRASAR